MATSKLTCFWLIFGSIPWARWRCNKVMARGCFEVFVSRFFDSTNWEYRWLLSPNFSYIQVVSFIMFLLVPLVDISTSRPISTFVMWWSRVPSFQMSCWFPCSLAIVSCVHLFTHYIPPSMQKHVLLDDPSCVYLNLPSVAPYHNPLVRPSPIQPQLLIKPQQNMIFPKNP